MNRLKTAVAVAVSAAAAGMSAVADVSFTVDAGKKTASYAFSASSLERRLYLAYGNADGGDTTNGWDSCVYVSTILPNATTLNNVALPDGYGKKYRAMRAFLEKPATAKDYVQDGLVVLYDGRENAGWGTHNDDVTTWRNLKSDNRNTDLPLTGVTVDADYMTFDKVQRTTTDGILSGNSDITLETSALSIVDDPNGSKWFIQVGGLGGFGFFYQAWIVTVNSRVNNDLYQCNWLLSGDYSAKVINDDKFHTLSAAIGYHEVEADVRVDGATDRKPRDTQYEAGYLATIDNPDWKFNVGSADIYSQIRSLRVYSRKLTAEEAAANAAVDVARFEAGTPPLESSATKVLETSLQITKINKTGDGTPVSIVIAYSATNIPRKVCIAWGKMDAGDVLADWENKSVLTNAAANSVVMTVLVPPAIGAEIAHRGFRVFLGSTTARDYVQDGLIVLYDCRENVGWGAFDGSAVIWRNLASDNRDTDLGLNVGGGDQFQTDNVYFKHSIYRKGTTAAVTSGKTTHTVELNMLAPVGISGVERWCAMIGGLGYVGFRGGDVLEVAYPQKQEGTDKYDYIWRWFSEFPSESGYHTYTAQFGNPGAWPDTYADATKKNQAADSYGWNAGEISDENYRLVLGFDSDNADMNVRGVRVYNKQLTPDEISRNAAVDEARFGDGCPFNTEATDFTRTNHGIVMIVR